MIGTTRMWIFAAIIGMTALISCDSLQNEGGTSWVKVKVRINHGENGKFSLVSAKSAATKAQVFDSLQNIDIDTVRHSLVFSGNRSNSNERNPFGSTRIVNSRSNNDPPQASIADRINSSVIGVVVDSDYNEPFDFAKVAFESNSNGMQDPSGTVTLLVPLDVPFRLIKAAFSQSYSSTAEVFGNPWEPLALGVSQPVTVNIDEAERTVDINMENAPGIALSSLIQVLPEKDEREIDTRAGFMVFFGQPMDLSTVTVNTKDNQCSGTIQVSANQNFSSCVRMFGCNEWLKLAESYIDGYSSEISKVWECNRETDGLFNYVSNQIDFPDYMGEMEDFLFATVNAEKLEPGKQYYFRLTSEVKDKEGNPITTGPGGETIDGSYNSSFFTKQDGATPPEVIGFDPENGSTNVAGNTEISVTFDEPMDPATITTNTTDSSCSGSFQVSHDLTPETRGDGFESCFRMFGDPVASNNDRTFTVKSAYGGFSASTRYEVRITTDAKNKNGTATSAVATVYFDTRSAPVQVAWIQPFNGTTEVDIYSGIYVIFNQSMDPDTITANTSADTSCSGSVQVSNDNFATCVQMSQSIYVNSTATAIGVYPSAPLASNTLYKIKIKSSALNKDGQNLEEYLSSVGFQTGESTSSPPEVASVSPSDSATGVDILTPISVTFDMAMIPWSITTNTSDTSCSGSIQVSTDDFATCAQMNSDDPVANSSNSTFSLHPQLGLDPNATYRVKVVARLGGGGPQDMSNSNFMIGDYVTTIGSGFQTGPPPLPDVVSLAPAEGEGDVDIFSPISVTFNLPMVPATITTNTSDTSCSGNFQVSVDGFGTCLRMVSDPVASNSDRTFTVQPYSPLAPATIHLVKMQDYDSGGIEPIDAVFGAYMAASYTSSGFITDSQNLPDTNQTSSFTNTFGEDHNYTIDPPAYTDNGDGTITDANTLLMWQKLDADAAKTWPNAGSFCQSLSLGSYSDWRLPHVKELQSLLDFGSSPLINASFLNTNSASYWTATPLASATESAWMVGFNDGSVSGDAKSKYHLVRCVRGANGSDIWPLDFTDNGDGTVRHQSTGLTWQQANGLKTWESALTECEALSLGGYDDWRLPNARELQTIIDYSSYSPAINSTMFPAANPSDYWSSTTSVAGSTTAMHASFNNGFMGNTSKTGSLYARCVRSDKPVLPDTGQTSSYTSTPGEDSDYSINPPLYSNNGDGTVTDNHTLLMWQRQDDNVSRTWSEAVSYCGGLSDSSYGNYSDWRLPNVKELQSIVIYGNNNPSIDTSIFPGTDSQEYWSSTISGDNTISALHVSFVNGYVYDGSMSYSYQVRCVRGGSESDIWPLDFLVIGDGTVIHQSTGLTWQQEDDNTERIWENALTYCEDLSLGVYDDWRLPNIRELQTIVDYSRRDPAIDTTVFPNIKYPYYWSSTSTPYSSTYMGLILGPSYGFIGFGLNDEGYYVRCVRGGQQNSRTPVANAGTDQNVYLGDTVTLDGSASIDPDGEILTYSWTMDTRPSGSSATLSGSTMVDPTFVADYEGTYVISLMVYDGTSYSPADPVTINAYIPNEIPVADAGPDQTVVAGSTVTLDGSASSDSDGPSALTYYWSIVSRPSGSSATLSDPEVVNPTFATDVEGTYTVYLQIYDGISFETDQVDITATAPIAVIPVPDTGQATSYTSSPGEDADFTFNPPSYTENGDGTVTDNNTLLMWQQQDDSSPRTWSAAVSYCGGSLYGHSDWRLPNAQELLTIVDYSAASPSINAVFTGADPSPYWSSTPKASDSGRAWSVGFNGGFVSDGDKGSASYYVRCVRGGSASDIWSPDYSTAADTIFHQRTGLTWERMGGSTFGDWEGALSYCEARSLGGYDDWRLPTIKELQTIVDYSGYSPSISTTFENQYSSTYWSSTTDAGTTTQALYANFSDGFVGTYGKTLDGYTRCVRGGGGILPDTNQVGSYTDTMGEDHDYVRNPHSHTDLGDGTVRDNNTLLHWQQTDDDATRNWTEAVSYCDTSGLGGYSDWRLPDAKEALSIMDFGQDTPAINLNKFPGTNSGSSIRYWTSTPDASNSGTSAWSIMAHYGLVANIDKTSEYHYTRCVRGDSASDIWTLDLSVVGNTVVHQSTGLIWQREDDDTPKTWETALSYCEGLTLDTYDDWRLPNATELHSIVDYSLYSPAINTSMFLGAESERYWSSTTAEGMNVDALVVYFISGYVAIASKTSGTGSIPVYVRCVRGGK